MYKIKLFFWGNFDKIPKLWLAS